MNHEELLAELEKVATRIRQQRIWILRALTLLLLAAAIVVSRSTKLSLILVMVAPLVLPFFGWLLTRKTHDPLWIARRIENRFPDLDARLLAALEQKPDPKSKSLGFLQQTVVRETINHAQTRKWETLVSASALRITGWVHSAALVCFFIAFVTTLHQILNHRGLSGWQNNTITSESYQLTVEPGDTSIERGAGLLVLARFNGKLPADAQLLSRDTAGQVQPMAMSRSLNDPVFAAHVPSLKSDLSYAVRYADTQTQWYNAAVFDFPDLKQADAHLKYPGYTSLVEKDVKDVRSVTAVEGTKATITFHLNKPVAKASLIPATQPATEPVKLVADPKDPTTYSISMELKQSQRFHLQLVDGDGRANREPPELAINVNPNKPPELKPLSPGHDIDVSPLQEMSVREQVSDDFGVHRAGLTYTVAGQPATEVVLTENVPAAKPREITEVLPLEKYGAQPDQLVSYYFWAEDFAADGAIRRTSGDMFFAEVRPFEEIFRQGQQPSEGEQQQQQNQSNQNNQNGQQADQLAEQEKQIIAATWKIMRRETASPLSAQFVPDLNLVAQSQATARDQAEAMREKLTDQRSIGFLANVLVYMQTAAAQLKQAANSASVAQLTTALSAEQSAYQALLKLRAREFDVVRGNRQQRGSQSASSASSRRQQQLDQLQLDQQEQNHYQTQNAATPQDNPQQRETRQVLSRLSELAQRQEDLNRQMRELQSALQQSRDEAQREEIQRQLARLRDQQQQQLRDTDELRDRMGQPENQERMADSRQQLEQTRENVRRASESLDKNKVHEAASAGARASEQLNNLRDDFRRTAAGQSAEAMTRMRQDARQLEENQQQLSHKLSALDNTNQRSLREGDDRKQLSGQLADQKQQLDKLLENMRKTSEEAEADQPLLSKQLYDSLRKTSEQQTAESVDAGRQLLDHGLASESAQAEIDAGKGVTQLRKDIEHAATTVLGDEAESLRQARNQLDRLSNNLQQEINRNRPAGQPRTSSITQPSQNQLARGNPTTRPGDRQFATANQPQNQQRQHTTPQPGQPYQPDQQSQQSTPGSRQQSGRTPGLRPNPEQGNSSESANSQQQPTDNNQPTQQANATAPQRPSRGAGLRGGPQDHSSAQSAATNTGSDNANNQTQQGISERDNLGGGDINPLTGDNFTNWSDQLRDVEEMVTDPRLRAQAATIRDRARDVRSQFKRSAKPPNWDVVNDQIGQPLAELRDAVAQELARKESSEALVPLDREAVPPQYADQVRRYYERLGSGR